jgi:hypothetical protein
VEKKDEIVVGVNAFQLDDHPEIERLKVDPAIEEAQRLRLAALRSRRNAAKTSALLEQLDPEQAYRSCQGILSYASKVGNDRLNKACHRALIYQDYSYMTIKTILERKMDQIPLDGEEGGKIMPLHNNIRGKKYYK